MIKSMTGYGKASVEITGRKLIIEIKTLNSKQFDLNLKIPGYFREKELEVRNILMQALDRGKVDFYISTDITGELLNFSVNHDLAKRYHTELMNLQAELKEPPSESLLPLVMKMPDVLQTSRDEISDTDWEKIAKAISDAARLVDNFRIGEGAILASDFRTRVETILSLLKEIEPFEQNRILDIRERMVRDFTNLASADLNGSAPDKNRFEQEVIYYLEKLDFTEEKVRLRKHCDYFLETLDEPVSQGKKLGFITQEMGREINTLGSKAADAAIQRLVVQMKDELEKIKEQLGNIL
ncbi:MAG: DUF1732 domain-containing protein [bacterium]